MSRGYTKHLLGSFFSPLQLYFSINLVTLPYHSSLCQLLTELCSVVLFLQLLIFNHHFCLDMLPFLDFQSHPTDKHPMVPTYFAVKKSFPFPISSFFAYLSYVLDQTNGNTKQRLYSVFNWALNDESKGKTGLQTLLVLCEKNNCPLNLITGCATLAIKKGKQVFAVTCKGGESFVSLRKNLAHFSFLHSYTACLTISPTNHFYLFYKIHYHLFLD